MRPIISWRNWLEEPGVTLTATSEVAGLGLRNTLSDKIGEVWRSTAGGAITITADLNNFRDVGVVALGAPRSGMLPFAHDGIRVQLSGVAPGGGEVLDTGTVSFASPNGVWMAPLAAGFTPNRVRNPSAADGSASSWAVSSQLGNAVIAPATSPFALTGVGGIQLFQPSGPRGWMAATAATPTTAAGGEMWAASVWVAPARCTARLAIRFRQGATTLLDTSASVVPFLAPESALRYRDGWRRLTVGPVAAPTGTTDVQFIVFGDSPTADAPTVFFTEAQLYRAEQVSRPSNVGFFGHVVPTDGGRSDAFATDSRWLTITIATARPYLQLGRLWVGPAWVPAVGAESMTSGLVPTGFSDFAPVSGQRFSEPGANLRRWGAEMAFLSEDDAGVLGNIGTFCGSERQVFAAQSVERWRETALFGHFEEPPAPQIQTFDTYPTAFTVKEDQ